MKTREEIRKSVRKPPTPPTKVHQDKKSKKFKAWLEVDLEEARRTPEQHVNCCGPEGCS